MCIYHFMKHIQFSGSYILISYHIAGSGHFLTTGEAYSTHSFGRRRDTFLFARHIFFRKEVIYCSSHFFALFNFNSKYLHCFPAFRYLKLIPSFSCKVVFNLLNKKYFKSYHTGTIVNNF